MTSLIISIYSSHLRGCSWFQRGLFDNDVIIQIANAQQSTIATTPQKKNSNSPPLFRPFPARFLCVLCPSHTPLVSTSARSWQLTRSVPRMSRQLRPSVGTQVALQLLPSGASSLAMGAPKRVWISLRGWKWNGNGSNMIQHDPTSFCFFFSKQHLKCWWCRFNRNLKWKLTPRNAYGSVACHRDSTTAVVTSSTRKNPVFMRDKWSWRFCKWAIFHGNVSSPK